MAIFAHLDLAWFSYGATNMRRDSECLANILASLSVTMSKLSHSMRKSPQPHANRLRLEVNTARYESCGSVTRSHV